MAQYLRQLEDALLVDAELLALVEVDLVPLDALLEGLLDDL